jgi:hypothetical protein
MKKPFLIQPITRKDTSHLIFCVVYISELELLEYENSYKRVFSLVEFVQIR